MRDLDRIVDAVRDVQEAELENRRRRLSVRNRLLAPPRVKRSGVVAPALIGGGLALAAITLLAVLGVGRPEAPSALRYEVAGIEQPLGELVEAPPDRPLPIEFSDGSTVALRPGSRGRVERSTQRGASVRVEDGTVEVDVVHRDDTAWQIACGPYVVHVVGTRFSASWDADQGVFDLQMDEGEVRVEGPELAQGQSLRAGESLQIEVQDAVAAVVESETTSAEPEVGAVEVAVADTSVEATTAELPDVARAVVAPTPPSAPAPVATRPSAPDWIGLAADAQDAEAIAAVDAIGFSRVLSSADAERLALLAAVLRRAGDGRANDCYRATRTRFPDSTAASDAAFHLGRTSFASGDAAGASEHLRTYLRERPNGRWAAEATGRLIELLHRSGREDEARSLAAEYLGRFPNGSHASFARSLAER